MELQRKIIASNKHEKCTGKMKIDWTQSINNQRPNDADPCVIIMDANVIETNQGI